MKKFIFLSALCLFFASSYAQEELGTAFDFWVGEWDLTWDEANGDVGKGTNHIIKILDGKVIQENFEATEGKNKGFKGTSLSVFNPRNETWHQAWADNQGGYFDFTGKVDGNKKIFMTENKTINGNLVVQRMVFYDISNDQLTWDWESSNDGGETWKLNWRINYRKK